MASLQQARLSKFLSQDRKFLPHEFTTSARTRLKDTPPVTMTETIKYLREIAHTCTRLARTCPDVATSHGLEEIAVDLMAKAQELEHHYEG